MFDKFLSYLQFEKRYSTHTVNAYQRDLNDFLQYSVLGEILARSVMSRANCPSISLLVSALTANPTSCKFSVRFRDVTTTSSSTPSCANATGATGSAVRAAKTAALRTVCVDPIFMDLPSHVLWLFCYVGRPILQRRTTLPGH